MPRHRDGEYTLFVGHVSYGQSPEVCRDALARNAKTQFQACFRSSFYKPSINHALARRVGTDTRRLVCGPLTIKRPERQVGGEELKALEQLQSAAGRGLAAAVFRDVEPVEGVKTHPELAGIYTLMASIEKRLEVDGSRPAAKAIVLEQARKNISLNIEREENVSVNVNVQQVRSTDTDREH